MSHQVVAFGEDTSRCETVKNSGTVIDTFCLLAVTTNHTHRQDKGWGGGRFLGL